MKKLITTAFLLVATSTGLEWMEEVSDTNPPWVAYGRAEAYYEGYMAGLRAQAPEEIRSDENKTKHKFRPLRVRPQKDEQ